MPPDSQKGTPVVFVSKKVKLLFGFGFALFLAACFENAPEEYLTKKDRADVVSAFFGEKPSADEKFFRWEKAEAILVTSDISIDLQDALRAASSDISNVTGVSIVFPAEYQGDPIGTAFDKMLPILESGKQLLLLVPLKDESDIDSHFSAFQASSLRTTPMGLTGLEIIQDRLALLKTPKYSCSGLRVSGSQFDGNVFALDILFVREESSRIDKFKCSYRFFGRSLFKVLVKPVWPNSMFSEAYETDWKPGLVKKDDALLKLLFSSEFPSGLPAEEFNRRMLSPDSGASARKVEKKS